MKAVKYFIASEIEDKISVTSQMCGLSESPTDFLRLTKVGDRIMLSDISPEIAIEFCHCAIQRDALLLDDDFMLQITYKKTQIEICVFLSKTKESGKSEKQYANLHTTTKLPFCAPTVCVYPFSAEALGILEAHGCGREWMASHYLLKNLKVVPTAGH